MGQRVAKALEEEHSIANDAIKSISFCSERVARANGESKTKTQGVSLCAKRHKKQISDEELKSTRWLYSAVAYVELHTPTSDAGLQMSADEDNPQLHQFMVQVEFSAFDMVMGLFSRPQPILRPLAQ